MTSISTIETSQYQFTSYESFAICLYNKTRMKGMKFRNDESLKSSGSQYHLIVLNVKGAQKVEDQLCWENMSRQSDSFPS